MQPRIDLIVGLGNPGVDYDQTRHNAGAWFVDALAQHKGIGFKSESRFYGEIAKITLQGQAVWLLKPGAYMNKSGQAVAALSNYYKIPPENILVAHDELDMPPGTVRLKQGGGHGGHNGLRDIISALGGNREFLRLRIGIGHPGDSKQVSDYVLNRPSADDKALIEIGIKEALEVLPLVIEGELNKAMHCLHSD